MKPQGMVFRFQDFDEFASINRGLIPEFEGLELTLQINWTDKKVYLMLCQVPGSRVIPFQLEVRGKEYFILQREATEESKPPGILILTFDEFALLWASTPQERLETIVTIIKLPPKK